MFHENQRHAIHISGAGPAGLAAAITVARAGHQAVVHELRPDVGGRFHGDFQGIENWTTKQDVLEELEHLGIRPDFDYVPILEFHFYGPSGRDYAFRSSEPIFYLVRRGPEPRTLDTELKQQALEAGTEIHFQDPEHHLVHEGIVAEGPRGADAIAVGYVFGTDMADGIVGVVSNDLAPKGYAYLIVNQGRGTVATGIFEDFHNESVYLERTLDFFRGKVGLRMQNPRRFGGTGNYLMPGTARRGNILFAGEAAGFQDALWGFGMRYAVVSGHLAARTLIEGKTKEYDHLWKARFGGLLRTGLANRFIYERLGHQGYERFLRLASRAGDVRNYLGSQYQPGWWKWLLWPFAQMSFRSSRTEATCWVEGCDCTWCRCQHGTTAAGGASA